MYVINLSVSGSPVQKNVANCTAYASIIMTSYEMKVSIFFKGENKSTSLFLKSHLVAADWLMEMETGRQAYNCFLLIFFLAKAISLAKTNVIYFQNIFNVNSLKKSNVNIFSLREIIRRLEQDLQVRVFMITFKITCDLW